MKKSLAACLAAVLVFAGAVAGQNNVDPGAANSTQTETTKKRGPVFRATKEQIKQAQALLKQRGLYAGEVTGKLDTDTRSGLKRYQEAEGLKVTGTLNSSTLTKMSIALTDKQRMMSKT